MPARPTTIRSDPAASTSSVTLRRGADDQRVGTRDHLEQFVGGQVEAGVDVVAGGTEAIEASVGDFFGDQDASHMASCLSDRTVPVPRALTNRSPPRPSEFRSTTVAEQCDPWT